MGKKKLTLSVDAAVVERAKRFSRRHRTSVSELVTRFLATLDDQSPAPDPTVRRLRGVLSPDSSVEDYHRHLVDKYR